jgi:hypothetical protein
MLETMDDIEEAKEDALINAGFRNRYSFLCINKYYAYAF